TKFIVAHREITRNFAIDESVHFSFTLPDNLDTSGDLIFRAYIFPNTNGTDRFTALEFRGGAFENGQYLGAGLEAVPSGDIPLDDESDNLTIAEWSVEIGDLLGNWGPNNLVSAALARRSATGTELSGALSLIQFS